MKKEELVREVAKAAGHGDGDQAQDAARGSDAGNLRHVSREEWCDTFAARGLNFIYQEQRSDGRQSDFFRLESPGRKDA